MNEAQRTALRGNTPPLARPEFDHGPAPLSLPMQRMLLVLTRSAAQETALHALLEQQQDKASPEYHKWLTPAEFGQQFGPSDQDIRIITSWLTSHGFQVSAASAGRTAIEFSGTAAQVQAAFHTAIHSYVVQGKPYWSNATDPQIPAALAPVVVGVDSMNNFPKRALHFVPTGIRQAIESSRRSGISPLLTYQCGSNPNTGAPLYCNAVTPYDFATIYNVLPLWNATPAVNGTGESIAIVARSNISLQDVADFRSLFGLPANPPQIILDGPDPGIVPGDETEADLDAEWAGAVARAATIKLVVSESTESTDGADLSAEYIVDHDLAPIMSESFGLCELFLGTAGNQFYNNLWQQAAAEGISVFVSAGDEGSAGCDFYQGSTPEPAKDGLQVNGLASTPYNVAVGGTDFNDFFDPLTYWNTTNNSATQESAKGYIPETTWNDSCTNAIFVTLGFPNNAEGNCNNSQLSGAVLTVGGSGGKSGCTAPTGTTPSSCSGGYVKPPWQTAPGVPSDGKRDLPDVSLFAADGFAGNFYAICEADQVGTCSATNFLGIGGTSVSSPVFAGLMALIDQKAGAAQGNPDFIFYKLAANQSALSCNSSTKPASTCVFNDITSGTIAMPCKASSLNCTTSTSGDQYGVLSGYNAGAGYDLATGLGSVNATNLVNDWASVTYTPSTTTLTLNGGNAVNITHGSPVSVSVSVSPTSPAPTGDVSLLAMQGANTFDFATLTLSNGTASGRTKMLPGGTSYTVVAHYEGDAHYGGSDSKPLTVTVNPEASATSLRLITFDPASGQITNPNATTVTYGSPYLLRADVTNSSATPCFSPSTATLAYACPTGTVSMADNGNPLDAGSFPLNSQGYTEDQSFLLVPTSQLTGGSHSFVANYGGDNSYDASSKTDAVTVTPAPTTTAMSPPDFFPQQTATIGQSFSFNVTTTSASIGAAPGGSYTVFDGTTQLVSSVSTSGSSGSANSGAQLQGTIGTTVSAPAGPHTLSVRYSGDANYASSISARVTINALYPISMSVTVAPNTILYGSGATVTIRATVGTTNPASDAALKPTGSFSFYGSYDGSINNPVTTTATQDSNGNWELQASMTFAPQESEFVSVKYSGDSNYEASLGGGADVTVTIPNFSVSSPAMVITAGQSGTSTLTITPATSYTSTVQLSCPSAEPFPGSSCSISPTSVTLSNGRAATATLTIGTTAPSSATSAFTVPLKWPTLVIARFDRGARWTLGFLTGLGALILLLLPGRKHSLREAWAFGLICLLSLAIGCGGGASGSNGGGGPAATTTVISVPSTKMAQGAGQTLNATVTSSQAATGTVDFDAADCNVSFPSTLTNGDAQVVFTPGWIGTCGFAAKYLGDAENLPSQSGTLNVTTTGTTSVRITGQTGTEMQYTDVNVTIQ